MTELDASIKTFCGAYINPDSRIYKQATAIAICNEQIVYNIQLLTSMSHRKIITHIMRNVISFSDTLLYAEVYKKLPDAWVCEEIFVMGFSTWLRFEDL